MASEGVLLVTRISNIDYWKTGNQLINVDLVNGTGTGTVPKMLKKNC